MKTHFAFFVAGVAVGALGYGFRARLWSALRTLVGRGAPQ